MSQSESQPQADTREPKLRPHEWAPIKESKGTWGYHRYRCVNCEKETHIGLDVDYEAKECLGKL